MNASLLGLSTKEVDKRFEEIVAFAELEQFIDNQVKFYSSGMYVRLGFAVAVNVDPDILVIDEVLAVGDEKFQRKCLERIKQFQEEGRTILFVTHAPDLVRAICDRVVVMETGHVIDVGPPGEAIRTFREHLLEANAGPPEIGNAKETEEATGLPPTTYRPIIMTKVSLEHPGQGSRTHMLPGEPLAVDIGFEALENVPDVVFDVLMYDSSGNLLYGTNTENLDYQFDAPLGEGTCRVSFESIPLLDGTYYLNVGIRKRSGTVFDWREQEAYFEVMNPGRETGVIALKTHADVFGPGLI
jgi:ABC-2 type transport system ATP-binding protein